MTKSDLIDLELDILAETDKAVKVFDGKTDAWLPKSQVEIERKGKYGAIVTLPAWLATDKGLA